MSNIKAIVRGSTLFVDVDFHDQRGDAINPSSAELRVAYTVTTNGVAARATATVEMTATGTTWTGSWDTSPADAGQLFWFVHAEANPKAAEQGCVTVEANPANPQG